MAAGTTLCVLADGATSCPTSGGLAKSLVSSLLEGFGERKQVASIESMVGLLREVHTCLRRRFPADSASYIVALIEDGSTVTTLHAGDCRLGRLTNQGTIHWLTPVHTLANAIESLGEEELRQSPNRHFLTRSFRAKRFQVPEYGIHELDERDEGILIASDGFWASLPDDEQLKFLCGTSSGQHSSPDDVSCLFLPLPTRGNAALRDISNQRNENLILDI
jgi:serine/threonine protein phosphatase PrpC